METVQTGKKYHIEHKKSTMATFATVLEVDGDTVRVSGDFLYSSYLLRISDYVWTEWKKNPNYTEDGAYILPGSNGAFITWD